jgi:hypothetical protein
MMQINEIEPDVKHCARAALRAPLSRNNVVRMKEFLRTLTTRGNQGMTLIIAASCLMAACSTPGTKHESKDAVAASNNAVAEASSSGAPELAPLEMGTAQDKLARANQALAEKDYKKAKLLADEALADAQAAQTKTNSIKAQQAAAALQDDIRVLREELSRATE